MGGSSFTRFWVIITAAFVLVILFIAGWFISFRNTGRGVLDQYNQQQLLQVSGTAGAIEAYFTDLAAGLVSIGELPEIQYFDGETARTTLTLRLEEMAPMGIIDLAVLDAAGTARIFAAAPEFEGVDYSWRGYFKDARELDPEDPAADLIVETQTVAPGQRGFVIARPLYHTAIHAEHPSPDGEFAGAILGFLTFEALAERYISPFKPPGGGQIFLVSQDFDVVWTTDPDMATNLLVNSQPAFEELISAMADLEINPGDRAGAYSFTESGIGADTELIAFAPFRLGNVTMAVVVRTPADVVRQTTLSNFRSQQVVFFGSGLTLLAGVLLGSFVLNNEVRKRFAAEEALRESEREQAVLEERSRLANELHDSVTQSLYGITLYAGAAQGQLAAGEGEKASAYLREIADAGQAGLTDMRMLIFDRRPPMLESEGLVAALEARLYAVERRSGVSADFDAALEDRAPLDVENELYRIALEALNNIHKHAAAQRIEISLKRDNDRIIMEIRDDGIGFDTGAALGGGGMGLKGMKERAQRIGGRLRIQSDPGEGTAIQVDVPL